MIDEFFLKDVQQLEEENKGGVIKKKKKLIPAKNGGYLYGSEHERAVIKLQRGIIWDVVKSIGSSLLNGLELVNVTLPVYIFEPTSYLQRIARSWVCYPLLAAGAKKDDPVERFLSTVAFVIGGLHETVLNRKPFNPILGETWEAEYHDGSKVYCEQTSHHPPVSHYEIIGKDFRLYGYGGYSASIRGNALKGQHIGPTTILFYKDNSTVTFHTPYVWISGIMWGDRVCDYCGDVTFVDEKNNLKLTVVFNPDQQGFFSSLFYKPATPSDFLRGTLKRGDETLGTVEGSWLRKVDFIDAKDGKITTLWDYETCDDVLPKPAEKPLPSDCRYRQDLQYLRLGKIEESKKWKHILEEKQRKEKRWRVEGL